MGQQHADEGEHEADLGPGVLDSTTGSSGSFSLRIQDHHDIAFGLSLDASLYAVRSDTDSSTKANRRMPTATPRLSTSWGWRSFSMPS